MTRSARTVVTLIVLLMNSSRPMTGALSSYFAHQRTASATDEPAYSDVMDYLMPVPTMASIPNSVDWRATVRTLYFGEPERYIVLMQNFGNKMEDTSVDVVQPEGGPVSDQLALILIHHPHATAKDAAALVNVRRWTIRGPQCRAAKDLAARFATIKAPVVPSSALVMDPPQYDIAVETRSESMRFALNGTGATPLIGWIQEAHRRIVVGCSNIKSGAR